MKKRLDVLIFERGFAKSREEAKRLILAGEVLISGRVSDKVGRKVDEKIEIKIKEKFPYVSRGALKLKKAYEEFGLDFKDKTICDIGSSTGGFTDFALHHGVKKVYAVDVGYGQLAQKIREDDRVVVMERTNIKDLNTWKKFSDQVILKSFIKNGLNSVRPESDTSNTSIPDLIENLENRELDSRPYGNDNERERNDNKDDRIRDEMGAKNNGRDKNDKKNIELIDTFVIDVSFISLKKVLPIVKRLAISNKQLTRVIALIKPQFEVGKKIADKCRGVVKDENIQKEVIKDIKDFSKDLGFEILGVTESPIKGAKGNKEFLIYSQI